MKLVAIIKVIDEDSGLVVREGDQIELKQAVRSFSKGLRIYGLDYHMVVTDILERLCEAEKRRKILQKREEGEG